MKNQTYPELSSAEPLTAQDRMHLIFEVWRNWSMSGDAGATSWDVLEGIQAQVSNCLYFSDSPESSIELAESLTAKAFLLREGQLNY